jgi:hypothetical protein
VGGGTRTCAVGVSLPLALGLGGGPDSIAALSGVFSSLLSAGRRSTPQVAGPGCREAKANCLLPGPGLGRPRFSLSSSRTPVVIRRGPRGVGRAVGGAWSVRAPTDLPLRRWLARWQMKMPGSHQANAEAGRGRGISCQRNAAGSAEVRSAPKPRRVGLHQPIRQVPCRRAKPAYIGKQPWPLPLRACWWTVWSAPSGPRPSRGSALDTCRCVTYAA